MKFNVTREWLVRKLAEMDAAGVNDSDCSAGGGFTVEPPTGVVVRAKMKCNSVGKTGGERYPSMNVQLGAVYSNDPLSENRVFANATPSASVNMNIDPGRPAASAFQLEGEYYVDFTPLEVQEYKFLRDGLLPPPVPTTIILSTRDHSDQKVAYFDPKDNTVSYWDGGERVKESPYNENSRLSQLGYTHWRYKNQEDAEFAENAG